MVEFKSKIRKEDSDYQDQYQSMQAVVHDLNAKATLIATGKGDEKREKTREKHTSR